jgi:lysozyme
VKLIPEVIELICHYESLHDGDLTRIGAQPKMDPVGIWTVGYGHALWCKAEQRWYKGEKDRATVYRMYPGLSVEQAKTLLLTDLPQYEESMLGMIKRRDLSPELYSGLTSFTYNAGTHYKNALGIRVPFKMWSLVDAYPDPQVLYNYWCTSVIKAGGKVLNGLVYRRQSEAVLATRGILVFNN